MSNYLGNGQRRDGTGGRTDVAVSRGPAGEFMYDFEPMRHEADRHPGATVRFWCPLNGICIAGVETQGGPVIDVEMGSGGFLTKPLGITP